VKDLPFPKKKMQKNKGKVVDQRRGLLQEFLQGLILGSQVCVCILKQLACKWLVAGDCKGGYHAFGVVRSRWSRPRECSRRR
jgi:hypothetical protein